jgi:cell division protein FtsI/penicillin-binding protein 2
MGGRRFLTLIALVLAGLAVLLTRLADVQIVEHAVWANEAANLVRKGRVEPYLRGEILDRNGRVLVKDRRLYQVEFCYRDFRRGHPLGLVAHAWSTLEMKPVPLALALANLKPWARALANLSPADLDAFAQGQGLRVGTALVGPSLEEDRELCASRAADLRFYVTELLAFDTAQRAKLRKLEPDEKGPSYLQFAAAFAGEPDTARRAAALDAVLDEAVEALATLARSWEGTLPAAGSAPAGGASLALLVADLEERRRKVEDETARDLFSAAAGFEAGQLPPEVLERTFDLEWISSALRWDATRTSEWIRATREHWLARRVEWELDRAVVEMQFARGAVVADRVLDELARLYSGEPRAEDGEREWSQFPGARVLDEVDGLFELDAPDFDDDERGPLLPFEDASLVEFADAHPDSFEVLARAEAWSPGGVTSGAVASAAGGQAAPVPDGRAPDARALELATREWQALFKDRWRPDPLRQRLARMVAAWDRRLEQRLAEHLAALLELGRSEGELSPRGKLAIAQSRLDRAQERTDYILKDRGSRPSLALREPDYPVVNLLTRYPESFRGFAVRETHRRLHLWVDERGRPLAEALLGHLKRPELFDLRRQRELGAELERLKRLGQRDLREQEILADLVGMVNRPDELHGADGLEAWFDRELSGHNGFNESRGLEEKRRRGDELSKLSLGKIDGLALTLTLDIELQRAAQECLERPQGDPDSSMADEVWLQRPTGAIVLLSPEGEVLVAASVPSETRGDPATDLPVRDEVRERTLGKPDFQPPGSVFKMFVAAWALDRLKVDPSRTVDCSERSNAGSTGPGYLGVHCWETHTGHGPVDLQAALKGSCNSYFAWMGEQFTPGELRAMAHEFGFGEPTGIRCFSDEARAGLQEVACTGLFQGETLAPRELRLAGNGLAIVEATPMQVARATAAIATGWLPDVRLVRSIGERAVAPSGRALQISAANLQRVREGLRAVTNEAGGTAHRALNASELGFVLAAKTGSADLTSKRIAPGDERVLKHAWVAGYFPADKPVGVLVVFVHQTTRTASHSAVWLARQFLERPELKAWLEEARREP